MDGKDTPVTPEWWVISNNTWLQVRGLDLRGASVGASQVPIIHTVAVYHLFLFFGFSIAFGVLGFEETVKKRALNVLDAWTEGLCTFRKTKKRYPEII
jgi:hypothetical protein